MTSLLRAAAWVAFFLGIVFAAPTLGTLLTGSSVSGATFLAVVVAASLYFFGGLVAWAVLTVCAEVLDYIARSQRG